MVAEYSSTYPCFYKGLHKMLPLADSVLRNRTVHIDLETLPEQPTAYDPSGTVDNPGCRAAGRAGHAPQAVRHRRHAGRQTSTTTIDSVPTAARPVSVPSATTSTSTPSTSTTTEGRRASTIRTADGPFTQNTTPIPTFPAEVYKLQNITNSHNGKFGEPGEFRAPAASSLADVDTAEERMGLQRIAAVMGGYSTSEIPDVASVMLGPVIRGSEVTVR